MLWPRLLRLRLQRCLRGAEKLKITRSRFISATTNVVGEYLRADTVVAENSTEESPERGELLTGTRDIVQWKLTTCNSLSGGTTLLATTGTM